MTEPQALEAWLAPLSRVAAAALAGIVLGLNRDLQGKPVGVRTLGVVAVAACVLTYAAIVMVVRRPARWPGARCRA